MYVTAQLLTADQFVNRSTRLQASRPNYEPARPDKRVRPLHVAGPSG